ncbi:chloramphenicol phosphotransferase CPT family protein [Actinoplanes sp. NPDC049265]|uniref:chloramphenicol phosphotransferase CPT family protein n=1 Tax=Actinoplanes sp. NPDC049265 TaxID=3363902 RepID=UPI00371D32FF
MDGQIVILNGPPRAGKSSIAAVMQGTFDGVWLNLGVDVFMRMAPARLGPGIGLRPGGERPDLEAFVVEGYRAMYASIAAHSRLGFNVVVDAVHHDDYSRPLGVLARCAMQLAGLPVLFVGVRCPVDVALERRRATWGGAGFTPGSGVRHPVELWHEAVHRHGVYDLEVDTSELSPEECAERIADRLAAGPGEAIRHVR